MTASDLPIREAKLECARLAQAHNGPLSPAQSRQVNKMEVCRIPASPKIVLGTGYATPERIRIPCEFGVEYPDPGTEPELILRIRANFPGDVRGHNTYLPGYRLPLLHPSVQLCSLEELTGA